MENMKIYLAAPIVGSTEEQKSTIKKVVEILEKEECFSVYNPTKHGVPNAWGMSMNEWARSIFALDVVAINQSDWVVVCDYGRKGTAGTAWECGYAFGTGKNILILEMYENDTDYSVMMRGSSANYCKLSEFLKKAEDKQITDLFIQRGRMTAKTILN